MKNNRWIGFIVACLHVVVIYFLLLQDKKIDRPASAVTATFMKLIVESKPIIDAGPSFVNPASHQINIQIPDFPALQFQFQNEVPYSTDASEHPYELPNKNNDKYQHLFDPRLREKLGSLKHFSKSKTRSVDGVEIYDMGDGACMLTSLSSQQSGNSAGPGWVIVKCGNTDSEQMVENMEKALADPMGLKN